jgi:toxin ParE1/3/4
VLETIERIPLSFPPVHGSIHRALVRRYPFAVFFRIRPETSDVIVLAVLPQRANPARWPRR